ncbi:hypothetical protein NOU13_25850 [Rhodococcus erythropolis]|uniref:hypothetical protein n=1 Tax=Rhodococcus erythropolis TaxID=1833 RepID=UPI0021092968|nr:hypothetical protein [Rhodococcus erythropolis]MCQ4127930.1 hypothetical protein [Rhodococcus erythropolis]
MSTYLSPLFYKARTDIDRLVRKHDGITAASYGLYHALMAISKTDLTDGRLDLVEVAKMASSLRLKNWKSALQGLLEAGLITEVTDTYIQLDWTGQTTREAIEKHAVTRADGSHDIPKMHERGDHTFCRKPHCDNATQWAKDYDENGKKGVTRKVTQKVTKGDPASDHPPVTQSQSQRQRQKDSGYDEDEKGQNLDSTPSPSGGARPEPAPETKDDQNRAPQKAGGAQTEGAHPNGFRPDGTPWPDDRDLIEMVGLDGIRRFETWQDELVKILDADGNRLDTEGKVIAP